MLLGKRPRAPMSRTISMTKFSGDFDLPEDSPAPPVHRIPAKIPAAGYRKIMPDFSAAPFLTSCGLCNRSLNLGRDIFMYRGEIAFCSLECRQQLMNQEEKKNSLSSLKSSAPANSAVLEPSNSGETVVAT